MLRANVARALLLLAAAPALFAATNTGRPLTPTALAFRLNGVNAGRTEQWQGGDRYLRVVLPVAGDPAASAQAVVAPLEFDLPVTELGPWLPILQEFIRGSSATHRLVVAEHFADRPGPAVAYTGARIEELVIDQVAGGGLLRLKVGAAASAVSTESPPLGNLPRGRSDRFGGGSFSVEVSGITDRRFVAEVGPLLIRAGAGAAQLVQPLTLRVQGGQQQPFRDWLDQTIGGTASGRTVTLKLLAPDLREERLVLTLANTLPVRVSRDRANSHYLVELVSNQLSLSGPTAQAATSAAATPPAAPPESATPATATPETPPAPATPAVATDPGSPATTAARARTDTPLLPGKRTLAGADQGLRDPAGFPRPSGIERVSYAKNDYPTQQTEMADYSGKMDTAELWQAYQEAAEAAGWKMEGANESGNSPETVMILSNWRLGEASADLRLYSIKGGGVKVSLSVTTQKAVRQ